MCTSTLAPGKYYANCFLHFEPTGPLNSELDDKQKDDMSAGIPPYLIPGSYWEEFEWKKVPVSRSSIRV
jgi:hypothetical protein